MRSISPANWSIRTIHIISALLAVLLVSVLVVRTSSAAFSATTDNDGNTFAADQITLSDNDAGAVMFDVEDLIPGDTEQRCITVSYTGSQPVDVHAYADATGDLAEYLDLDVDYQETSTNTFADCTGFTADGSIYSGTLDGYATTHSDFATGADTWAASADEDRVYRFTVTMQDDNAAQGTTAGADFIWEAQTN